MRDEPSGAALIEAARRALIEDVVPDLAGRPRYVALMVANALGIAAREIDEAAARDAAGTAWNSTDVAETDALVRAIRAGTHDADAALYATLVRDTAIGARIWKPVPR